MKTLAEVKEVIHSKRWSVNGLKVSRKSLLADQSVPEDVRHIATGLIDSLIEQQIEHDLGINRSCD